MSEIGKHRPTSNDHYNGKRNFDTIIANKSNESRKLPCSKNNEENVQDSKSKEKLTMSSSRTFSRKYSPAVLIPYSQRSTLSNITNSGDNILHPELIVSPRTGCDIINRRGTFYLGRRRKLIIGSIGDNNRGNSQIIM